MTSTNRFARLLALAVMIGSPIVHARPAPHGGAPARAPSPPRTGPAVGPRSFGVHVVPHPDRPMHPKENPPHTVIVHDRRTNRDERHYAIVDHRPPYVIDHDAHLRITARGYHSRYNWERFHRERGGWWSRWGIVSWDIVGTVTCEAVNETTGALYPVSEDRDRYAWDDAAVNAILDQALDDCVAEANGAVCGPVMPACTFQPY